ncbi:TonB family protein [Hymenobacter algoricola]|uniref:Energy transducer TonB n=1 Tax=Hymenobacter algoricola TaxID=486267 RepID=A0ABP7NHM2_9BACT
MNTMQLSTASLDDIVFEGRNQSYGAYVLRRVYSRHLVAGLTFSVVLCLLLVSLPVLIQRLWPAVVVVPPIPVLGDIVLERYDLPKEVAPPAEQHAVVVAPPKVAVPTTVVKDPLVKPKDEVEQISTVDPDAVTGPVAIAGVAGPAVVNGPGTAPGIDSNVAVTPPPAQPFIHAEVMPEFAGGLEALRQYMQRNLHYPRQALAAGVSGKVFVSFTVQASGAISDVQVLKGLGYGTDEEAARVIKAMPTWTPGRQNSHAVAVRYTLPITFHYE